MGSVDHRTQAGLKRRQRMRRRLLESALVVFSEKGLDGAAIDDMISQAGVARGTFYNYFRTMDELLVALGEQLGNELIDQIEAVDGDIEDPVEILASGLRLFLHTARNYPRFANFIWRAGFNAASAGHLIFRYLPRHILASMDRGAFRVADAESALETIAGITLASVFALSTRPVPADYPERMVVHILMALGVAENSARKLVERPLPSLDQDGSSLWVRVHS